MAKIEIDETEYAALGGIKRTVDAMLANPEARKKLLSAQKTVNPNAVIPEIDAAEPVKAELEATNKTLADIRKEIAEEKAARELQAQTDKFMAEWEKQKAKLRKDGFFDEAIDEIEKLAKEKNIADLDLAASHYIRLHPPEAPVQPGTSSHWNLFDPTEAEESLIKDFLPSQGEDNSVLNKAIKKSLDETRGQRRVA